MNLELRRKSEIERLDKSIVRLGPDDCWPWIGGVLRPHGKRYPHLTRPRCMGYDPLDAQKQRHTYPTRLMYLLHRGRIPEGLTVDHICFNRMCCNPAHLQLLTRSENTRRRDPNAVRVIRGNALALATLTEIAAELGVVPPARATVAEVAEMCLAAIREKK